MNGANSGWKCANLILISWANCIPIAFELQQGSPCVFTNLPNLLSRWIHILNSTTQSWTYPNLTIQFKIKPRQWSSTLKLLSVCQRQKYRILYLICIACCQRCQFFAKKVWYVFTEWIFHLAWIVSSVGSFVCWSDTAKIVKSVLVKVLCFW